LLALAGVALDAVHVSGVDESFDPATQAQVELVATALLRRVIEAALGAATPALPIPAFEIPASLGIYGLPVGDELGLVDPVIGATPTHLELTGSFGVRGEP
jgi:hypothetical protein